MNTEERRKRTMELNAEQIENALACRSNNIVGCMNDECAYFHKGCERALYQDALALIKELTEENKAWQMQLISHKGKSDKAYHDLACEVEDLRAENERLKTYLDDHFPKCIYQYDGDVQEYCVLAPCGQFKTVAEFQKQIEADTVQKLAESLKAVFPSIAEVIDYIAKKMLEGETP